LYVHPQHNTDHGTVKLCPKYCL